MKQIELSQATFAYHDSLDQVSEPKNNYTLLLVHGFPLSHRMWLPVVEELQRECRLIAPDLRGYGESLTSNQINSLYDYASDLSELLDKLSIEGPIVFVGFSMGGYIAWEFLQQHADRLAGLALVDTRAGNDTEASRDTRHKMADKIGEWGTSRVAEIMRPNLFSEGTDESIVEETIQVIKATDPVTIAASQRAMAARPDSTELLRSINLPTQVIVGESDAISTAEEMKTIADAIPGAEFSCIKNAGHMAPAENPSAVASALLELANRIERR